MKRILYISVLLSILCGLGESYAGDQKAIVHEKRPIRGNGIMAETEMAIQPFDALHTSGTIKVTLVESSDNKIRITADDNILDLVEVKQKGSRLSIGLKSGAQVSNARIEAIVPVGSSIRELSASSMSDITCRMEVKSSSVTLMASSYGTISADVSTDHCTAESTSNGHIDLRANGGSYSLTTSNGGRIEAHLAVKTCTVNTTRGGETVLTGTAKMFNATCSLGGCLKATRLIAEQGKIISTTGAKAKVYCTGELTATVSSDGKIRHKGNCTTKNKALSEGSIKNK